MHFVQCAIQCNQQHLKAQTPAKESFENHFAKLYVININVELGTIRASWLITIPNPGVCFDSNLGIFPFFFLRYSFLSIVLIWHSTSIVWCTYRASDLKTNYSTEQNSSSSCSLVCALHLNNFGELRNEHKKKN